MNATQNLRILSQIFSPPMFQKIVREGDVALFQKQTTKYLNLTDNNYTNLDIIKLLYKMLQKKYRCEYIYKNYLFLNIIKEYGLTKTLTINEFKISSSKADLLLLNGSARVFEIKTELDDFSKLSKQLEDYQKFADFVFIVTNEKNGVKLSVEYANTNIGIIIFNGQNKLEMLKEAGSNVSLFDFDTIFKLLRKQEYLDLVADNFGVIPAVPNTKIFRACYEELATIDIIKFQQQVINKLKERKLLNPSLLRSRKTPKELKYICNSLNFNEQEYHSLYNFLKEGNQCISHM
ncbi:MULTISPECIES: sce7726 family protein [Pasteurellaceae]|uniref:Sce7726 family protein n=1 Tax=Pasteurella atlantica TaxID=2827233 RepID=A0AAW8CQ51_9PAST|nr:sce7726 family protein [Pasteurella atlantica]MDP8040076.1 sce7726 family protein [Pasteurella atlantica]MDP8042189.1 sce7726 family protein [Pasteurella atlantica]MDP8044404.1 sce7726 family protein [Pasteurella atlantica]MDP8046348.1 sce7726 family protein [Pasteurella atlantica]MDP8062250.1 sce7726 family protein [Pasteurella atlantica]